MTGENMRNLGFGPEHAFYHGSIEPLPDLVSSGDETSWWKPIDHAEFLEPSWDEEDGWDNGELAAELRTAYANVVYEAFLTSEDPELRAMAENSGLSGLGAEVGILFVTDDLGYVQRYGEAHEIDIEAPGILHVIEDENASRPSWMVVMREGMPFPLKNRHSPSMSLFKS